MTPQNSWWWPLPALIVNTSTMVMMAMNTMTISFNDYYEHFNTSACKSGITVWFVWSWMVRLFSIGKLFSLFLTPLCLCLWLQNNSCLISTDILILLITEERSFKAKLCKKTMKIGQGRIYLGSFHLIVNPSCFSLDHESRWSESETIWVESQLPDKFQDNYTWYFSFVLHLLIEHLELLH